ncbi:MAG: hypothetical protein ACI4II_08740, partial [Acutalibacteraceae bacterium]
MKKHPTLTSIIIAFFRTALLLVLLVLIIISTASVFLRNSIFSKELFIQQITSDQYISEVTEFIDRTIKQKCMAYKLPYDEFRPIITDIRIRNIAERYANNLYESLIHGTPMEDIDYPSDDIFKYLKDYLQNKRIMASDDDIKFFAEDIAHDITVNIVAINESYGGVNLIKPLSKYIFNNGFLRTIAEYSDLLVVACAFLTIITWILCSADFKSGLFNVASIYWLAGLFMFVPVMYFQNHNVLNGVSIGDTPVKSLINVLAPPIIDSLTTATMTVFITASVIMLYTIGVYIGSFIVKRKKVNEDISEEYTEDYMEDYTEVYPIETAPCEIEENVRVRLYFPELNPPNETDKAPDIINSDTTEDTDTVDESSTDDVTELIVDTDNNDITEDADTVDEVTTDDVTELIVDT